MFGLAIWLTAFLVSAAGVLISFNDMRLARDVTREGRALVAAAGPARPLVQPEIDGLPVPVRRYLGEAVGYRPFAIRTVRLTHGGVMRKAPDAKWLPIRGQQYFRADPPAFRWWGRLRVAPGIWVDARDSSVGGVGRMLIQAAATFTMDDATGAEIDQGALLRLLGEMTWFPTAFADGGYVSWRAVDDQSAEATLRLAGREVKGLFTFGADGLPARMSASRYRQTPAGAVLTPWHGTLRDFRAVDGVIVPWEVESVWDLPEGEFAALRFTVEEIVFDDGAPR
ncbi:MAG: DUF6544 family protein [Vicinamibacterales bacterium]